MKLLRKLQIRWGEGMLILALFALFCAHAAIAYFARPVWNETHAPVHDVPFESVDFRVDINRASAEELTQLSGIGEVLARRIVDYRDAHGAFTDAEQLKNVEGIGEAKLEALIPQIKISGNDS